MTLTEHSPVIEPCRRSGLLKLACACGWRASAKFKATLGAETYWAKHVNGELR